MTPVEFGLEPLGVGDIEAAFWHMAFLMTRVGAAMLAAPIFGSMGMPVMVRVATTGAIAIFLTVWLPVETPALILSLPGMLAVAGEVVVGLALGFALQVAFAAPVVAAEIMGGSMGLSMAVTGDPNSGAQVSAFGQYFTVVLVLIFLATGGHLHWLRLIMESYAAFPPGETWLGPERFRMIAGFGGFIFATGLAIALPVSMVLLLVQMVTGTLSRAAPSLNLFALGLPAGVLAGLAALIMTAPILFTQLEGVSTAGLEMAASVLLPTGTQP